jgi:hypothetical protein
LEVPSSGYVPIDKISYTRISKQADSPGVVIMKNKVTNGWRCDEARESENIRNCIDVLMWSELRDDIKERLLRLRCVCSMR